MGYSAFKLDGIAIKNPSSLDFSFYTLTNSTRVANGDMRMQYRANKRTFNLSYSAISSKDLDTILDILWTNLVTTKQCFHTLTYLFNGETKTATVYSGELPFSLHRGHGSNWVWKDLKISLIEK